MFSFKTEAPQSANRTKVEFPVDLAVDNVTLRSIERTERITGINFNFQRVEGETIAWLTGSILPPKKEWFTENKTIGDKTITADDQFMGAVRSFMGYVKHILNAAGVSMTALDDVRGENLEQLIDNAIAAANPLIDIKATFYLKTVKDKNGYTKIPQYRGTGVAQATELGYPSKHAYSIYEQDILDSINGEGVVDSTILPNKNSGLDF
jgi:hypothetical protein